MDALWLAAKTLVATMLIVAGAAKAADPASFSHTVALFFNNRPSFRIVQRAALTIAMAESTLGLLSLSLPDIHLFNMVTLIFTVGFLIVSALGYAFHRGEACRCFGHLSNRTFDLKGLLRNAVVVVLAATAIPAARPTSVRLSLLWAGALFLAGILTAVASFSAARSLGSAPPHHQRVTT